MNMERNAFKPELRNNYIKTRCLFCEKKNEINKKFSNKKNKHITNSNLDDNIETETNIKNMIFQGQIENIYNLKNFDPNFYFNKFEIERLLDKNYIDSNELINPCSCDKKYHKNCILLYVFHTNNIYCEDCLEIFNIRASEKKSFCSVLYSSNYFPFFFINIVMIISISFLIYYVFSSNLGIDQVYHEMKIFFIVILFLLNFLFVTTLIFNLMTLKNNIPPKKIWVEDKNKIFDDQEINNLNNLLSENQNSNQNFLSNNLNNVNSLNQINHNSSNGISNSRGKYMKKKSCLIHHCSTKNFCDYNNYFLNIYLQEIFESKVNYINYNKLIIEKSMEHLNALKELNDDEFQQNILIKYMDFNSSNDSIDDSFKLKKHKMNNMNNQNQGKNFFGKQQKKNLKSRDKTPEKKIKSDYLNESDISSDNTPMSKQNNGMIGGVNNRHCGKNKIKDTSSDNNFNTNINSNSGEKFKFSNKELNNLNSSITHNDNQDNTNVGTVNIYNNNNNEKLILKENYFNSNTNLNRYNTQSSKFRSKNSSNNILQDNININKNAKFDLNTNEGVNYRDFIVTEEKNLSSKNIIKNLVNPPKSKASEDKQKVKRKDSKIPSAIFGDLQFKSRNSNTSINNVNISPLGSVDKESLNGANNPTTKPIKKVISRRYSSFSPGIINNLAYNGPTTSTIKKQKVGVSGMNIFSNNMYGNYNFDKNYSSQSTFGNSFEHNKLSKKISNNSNEILKRKTFQNENSGSLILHQNLNNNLKYSILQDEDHHVNFSGIKKYEILNTVSPKYGKIRSHEFERTQRLKGSTILKKENLKWNCKDIDNNIMRSVESLRAKNSISNSHVGLSRNIMNKLSQEASNNMECMSPEKQKGKNVHATTIINFKNLPGHEERKLKKSSFLNNVSSSPLNTINEDIENFNVKSNSKIMPIGENNISDFNDEHVDKKDTINSEDEGKKTGIFGGGNQKKNIKNHLMDNLNNVISEDNKLSETFSDSSDSSEFNKSDFFNHKQKEVKHGNSGNIHKQISENKIENKDNLKKVDNNHINNISQDFTSMSEINENENENLEEKNIEIENYEMNNEKVKISIQETDKKKFDWLSKDKIDELSNEENYSYGIKLKKSEIVIKENKLEGEEIELDGKKFEIASEKQSKYYSSIINKNKISFTKSSILSQDEFLHKEIIIKEDPEKILSKNCNKFDNNFNDLNNKENQTDIDELSEIEINEKREIIRNLRESKYTIENKLNSKKNLKKGIEDLNNNEKIEKKNLTILNRLENFENNSAIDENNEENEPKNTKDNNECYNDSDSHDYNYIKSDDEDFHKGKNKGIINEIITEIINENSYSGISKVSSNKII